MLATYAEEFYAGMPALTVNNYGNGKAYYQAFRDDGAFADMLVSRLPKGCGISGAFDGELPEGVTAHSRTDGENTFSEVLNYMDENNIPLAGAVHDFICPLTGKNYMFFPVRKI